MELTPLSSCRFSTNLSLSLSLSRVNWTMNQFTKPVSTLLCQPISLSQITPLGGVDSRIIPNSTCWLLLVLTPSRIRQHTWGVLCLLNCILFLPMKSKNKGTSLVDQFYTDMGPPISDSKISLKSIILCGSVDHGDMDHDVEESELICCSRRWAQHSNDLKSKPCHAFFFLKNIIYKIKCKSGNSASK